jgi:hypothetical protein
MILAWMKRLSRYSPHTYSTAILHNHLINLGIAYQVQVLMDSTSAMDICMCRVRSTSSIPVNPFEPVLSTVASDEVLEIVCGGDSLTLARTKEVLHDWIRVITKGDLDWALESMDITVVGCTLVGLVLFHQRNELLSSPAFGLEVVIVRGRSSCVHHKVNGGPASKDVSTRHDCTATSKPFRGARIVE